MLVVAAWRCGIDRATDRVPEAPPTTVYDAGRPRPQARCDACRGPGHRQPALAHDLPVARARRRIAGPGFPAAGRDPPFANPRIEIYVDPAQSADDLARAIAHELGHMHHTRDARFVPEWLSARGLPPGTPDEIWTEDYAEVFAALFAPPSEQWRGADAAAHSRRTRRGSGPASSATPDGVRSEIGAAVARRPSAVLYLAAVAVLPWVWMVPFPVAREQAQWGDLFIALAAAAWLVEQRREGRRLRFRAPHAALLLYLAASGASLLVSPARHRGVLLLLGMAGSGRPVLPHQRADGRRRRPGRTHPGARRHRFPDRRRRRPRPRSCTSPAGGRC